MAMKYVGIEGVAHTVRNKSLERTSPYTRMFHNISYAKFIYAIPDSSPLTSPGESFADSIAIARTMHLRIHMEMVCMGWIGARSQDRREPAAGSSAQGCNGAGATFVIIWLNAKFRPVSQLELRDVDRPTLGMGRELAVCGAVTVPALETRPGLHALQSTSKTACDHRGYEVPKPVPKAFGKGTGQDGLLLQHDALFRLGRNWDRQQADRDIDPAETILGLWSLCSLHAKSGRPQALRAGRGPIRRSFGRWSRRGFGRCRCRRWLRPDIRRAGRRKRSFPRNASRRKNGDGQQGSAENSYSPSPAWIGLVSHQVVYRSVMPDLDPEAPRKRSAEMELPCEKNDQAFDELRKSPFRRRFHLEMRELAYVNDKGLDRVLCHARDFIDKRLAPPHPERDGKQTPFRGHPVFIAQHATGTCCRSCLDKWHGISRGRALDAQERDYVVAVLERWIRAEMS
jgi:hypothetical protein